MAGFNKSVPHHCGCQFLLAFILSATCFVHGLEAKFSDNTAAGAASCGVDPRRHNVGMLASWRPSWDVMTEAEAYMTVPPLRLNQTVSRHNSIVIVKDNITSYHVGDMIKLRVKLYDQSGRKRCTGGDSLRVRMYEEERGAYINGFVNDHRNGKYTVLIPARWAGTPRVEVYLMYTREEIAYMYSLRRQVPTLRIISAVFGDGRSEELVDCNAVQEKLDTSRPVCDFTARNGHEPWFCQHPRHPDLTCAHFQDLTRNYTSYRTRLDWSKFKNTNPLLSVGSLSNRVKTDFAGPFDVTVKEDRHLRHEKSSHLPNCTDFDRVSLWHQRSPSGYFHDNTWHVMHCRGKTNYDDYSCLKDKIFYFYGDSTLKQWYENMKARFACKNIGGLPFKEMRCHNGALDLTMRYIRHNMPGNVMVQGLNTRMLEDVSEPVNGREEIFLIHIYSHYSYYHHNVYRKRIRRLKNSVARLLYKKPNAKVMIKGPTTISKRNDFGIVDYFAPVYKNIIFEEFAEFHDKVIYLENADMTTSLGEKNIHVRRNVVAEMVNNMLMYVCNE